MDWLRIDANLPQHPKVRRLAARLQCSKAQALGHVVALWGWTMQFRAGGDLAGFEACEIADGALWDGDVDLFVVALRDAGFLDGTGLHDWHEYQGVIAARRERDRQRMVSYRQRTKTGGDQENANVTRTSRERSCDVLGDVRDETYETNVTNERSTRTRVTRTHDDGGPPFLDFWTLWPHKVARPRAEEAFGKLAVEQRQAAIAGLPGWLGQRERMRAAGQFVPELPHPATWLRSRRWEDQPAPAELAGSPGRPGSPPKTNNTASQTAAMDYEALEARFPGQFTAKAQAQREARERGA